MTRVTRDHIGTVKLVDRKTRVVEILGPQPFGSRRPTDRKLFVDRSQESLVEFMRGPEEVAHCFAADGRTARFLVDESPRGEALLDLLARNPKAQARPARPWGVKGWLVEG